MGTSLVFYPAWLGRVNAKLSELTGGTLSAEDFDYPWIEQFMAYQSAESAAEAALAADGFVIEKLPAPIMKGRAACQSA